MDQCRYAWGGGGVLPIWTSVGMPGGGDSLYGPVCVCLGGYSLYGPV